MAISKEAFMNLSSEQMWQLFSEMQLQTAALTDITAKMETQSSSLSQLNLKIDGLLNKVEALESEIIITKSVNKTLNEEVFNLRRKINRDCQYQRQDNIEISGIPTDVRDDELETKSIFLLKKIGVTVSSNDVVDCHRLPKRGTVIMRFVNRKYANQAISNGKRLRNLNTSDIFRANPTLYVNRNLIPEYMSLRWKAKKMKAGKYVHAFGTNKRGVWIQINEDSGKKQVECDEDLQKILPEGININDICR